MKFHKLHALGMTDDLWDNKITVNGYDCMPYISETHLRPISWGCVENLIQIQIHTAKHKNSFLTKCNAKRRVLLVDLYSPNIKV